MFSKPTPELLTIKDFESVLDDAEIDAESQAVLMDCLEEFRFYFWFGEVFISRAEQKMYMDFCEVEAMTTLDELSADHQEYHLLVGLWYNAAYHMPPRPLKGL